jgi:hypothetical protein
MSNSLTRAWLAAAAIAGMTSPLWAQENAQEWVKHCENQDDRDRRHCEVREYTLAGGGGVLRIDANPNGGVRVMAWDKAEVRVVAKVEVRGESLADAQALAREVTVETGSREVHSTGPHNLVGHRNWSVSYDVWAPAATDLRLRTTNGGLNVEGINGVVDIETTNGGIDLKGVAGDVRAETTNGGITIALAGSTWNGAGIRAETTNGGIRLIVPEGFSAMLEAETTNGGIDVDFPVTIQGRLGKDLHAKLGDGGPIIHLETTNGGVSIRRR